MDARTALKNFHEYMVCTYGENYSEHWTQDDRETFEILARRARKVFNNRQIATRDDTPFLRRLKGTNAILQARQEDAARQKQWAEWAEKYGSGVVGTLREERLYDGVQPKKRKIKSEPVVEAPKINPDDVDSSSIFAYLMSN